MVQHSANEHTSVNRVPYGLAGFPGEKDFLSWSQKNNSDLRAFSLGHTNEQKVEEEVCVTHENSSFRQET